ncbi:histidine triad nucleotide-binding protein [Laceyella sacchari]|jgi:histidine triad (HIT) family protein|uniref:Histidine triad nucleotide-binding protein n=1 Tax=Laceyella sacchari TaxID=37482 RepID=A0ABY5TZL5_LACSH|nr:histidine triad nucleotide-binding protein [Laceyella sacchari]TCW37693.1 histidine triad (HIT) family protein [Laceyella sacchari]UWE02842.1 histidine triad nucleotide-binding protein [Laceyella sacchari]
MEQCIFCQIVEGKIPSKKVYEDEHVLAFHDISPVAPTHVLVIPKRHIASLMEIAPEDHVLLGKIFSAVQTVSRELGLAEKGFRVVNNIGEDGGQTVHHIHFHVIGGRTLTWPPG